MSEQNASTNEKKWTCNVCTFENWPKSSKCTICLAPNQSLIILNEPTINTTGTTTTITTVPSEIQPLEIEEQNKWSCATCTYLNWPKSQKCVQCLNIRQDSKNKDAVVVNGSISSSPSPSSSPSSSFENERNMANESSLTAGACAQTPEVSRKNSIESFCDSDKDEFGVNACKRARTPPSAKDDEADESISVNNHQDNLRHPIVTINNMPTESSITSSSETRTPSTYTQNKWNCSFCTYENWPKATHCVMCTKGKAVLTGGGSCSISSSNGINSTESVTNELPTLRNSLLTSTNNTKLEVQPPTPVLAVLPTSPEIISMNNKNLAQMNGTTKLINNTANHFIAHPIIRRLSRDKIDCTWLEACIGVVNGDSKPVRQYIRSGGDLARQLTLVEANLLNRPSAFEIGYTLVHLAVRFKRNKILELLLENRDVSRVKRVPCTVSLNFAPELRKQVNNCFQQRKGNFPCNFVTEFVTFALPQEIEDLTPSVQQRLFDELLDRDVQKELEEDSPIINWSLEISVRLGSRLYALWNRSTGDCLLDSCLQATWGLFDKENRLRKALADSLADASHTLFSRFKNAEMLSQSNHLNYTLDQLQWEEDWAVIVSLAAQPGSALEQFHIFTLAHILRRPVLVYGVKYVKSFRGETLGFANFQGIYLPLHWDSGFCSKSPISLGYTRGHFSALVPMECLDQSCETNLGACGGNSNHCDHHRKGGLGTKQPVVVDNDESLNCVYLPLVNSDHELLPLHFLNRNELGREEEIMRQYLDCCLTENGTLVAKQKLGRNPYLMQQMIGEWVDYYRTLSHGKGKVGGGPSIESPNNGPSSEPDFLSDQDSD